MMAKWHSKYSIIKYKIQIQENKIRYFKYFYFIDNVSIIKKKNSQKYENIIEKNKTDF